MAEHTPRSNTGIELPYSNEDIHSLEKIPIDVYNLSAYLRCYSAESFLINGYLRDFELQYNGPRIYRESTNLKSAIVNPSIVEHKIHKELLLQRIGGPFEYPQFPSLQMSPLGPVPQKDRDFRLIHHLSFPEHQSINSFIEPAACSVHYASVDGAAAIIASLGAGTLLAKSDIKSAFWLIHVAKNNFDLLGFKFQGKCFFDKMVPFGAFIICGIWEKFATALHRII